MIAANAIAGLVQRLPAVRGRYQENAPLAPISWFRVGGPAEVMFHPADEEDLASFLARRPADVPITVLGVASNVLIRDGGIRGVVIRLGRAFTHIAVDGHQVEAGAAAMDVNVARAARDAAIAGLEFLIGIPGTIGGGLRMNAGAFGADMSEIVVTADAVDAHGHRHHLTAADFGFAYRRSAVPADWIFVSARLQGRPGETAAIARRMDEIRHQRDESQPTRVRTGGSTFTNPAGDKAWRLIDAAGCRGLRHGGAIVSTKHCNFLVNSGLATAADLEALGEEVRRRVRETSGVELKWEIRRLGVPAANHQAVETAP